MRYLTFALALIAGCGGIATVPGDTYSAMVSNDGKPTWARTVGDVKRCEYFYNGGRWLEVDYSLEDWDAWLTATSIRNAKITRADGRVEQVSVEAVEPRVKSVRYDIGAAWRGLR